MTKTKIILIALLAACWSLAAIFPHYQEGIQTRLQEQLARTREKIPRIKIDFHPNKDPRTAYNSTKLALLIEGRPQPQLVPHILHMISVVPHDWRFLYIGSNTSVASVGRSFAIKYQQAAGKLDLMIAPKPWEINDKENIWRMLTDTRFYDELLPGVEWLLKYETDSILCSRSDESLNDWLHWDWAAAPRTPDDKFAGNGGLSIRRVSVIKRILGFQQRENNTQPEDEWFGKRIVSMPMLKAASAADAKHFAVEDVYHENPMGYHLRMGQGHLPEGVWKNKDQRKKILEYCPDVKIILPMKLERERCEGDNREGFIDPQVKIDREERERKEAEKKKAEEEAKKAAEEAKKAEAERKKQEQAKAIEDQLAKIEAQYKKPATGAGVVEGAPAAGADAAKPAQPAQPAQPAKPAP